MTIYFYKREDEYGYLSNFAHYPFELDGHVWPTSEHYFQACKFEDEAYFLKIKHAKTPMEAARLGRSREVVLRSDWELVKDDVMRRAVFAKFSQNTDIQAQLLSTRDEQLIEATTDDYYWGQGTLKTGKNMLGHILMEVREALRMQQADDK